MARAGRVELGGQAEVPGGNSGRRGSEFQAKASRRGSLNEVEYLSPRPRNMGILGCVASTMNAVIGTGILALPVAFSRLGSGLGSVVIDLRAGLLGLAGRLRAGRDQGGGRELRAHHGPRSWRLERPAALGGGGLLLFRRLCRLLRRDLLQRARPALRHGPGIAPAVKSLSHHPVYFLSGAP
jgi:hypothetical protein